MEIELKEIVVKDEIQQRAGIDQDYVDELSAEIAAGADLPPVDVYDVDGALLLADGFHRLRAFMAASINTVQANVIKGTERDAILHAVGANADHGLRRSNADKRRAVMTLLNDEQWRQWSDCEIARKARVSQTFVSKVKRELTQHGAKFSSVRKCKDGRVVDTSKIGSRPKDDPGTEKGGGSAPPESEASEGAVDVITDQPGPEAADSLSEAEAADDSANQEVEPDEAESSASDDTDAGKSADESYNLYEMIAECQKEKELEASKIAKAQANRDQSHADEATEVSVLRKRVAELEEAVAKRDELIKQKDEHIEKLENEVTGLNEKIASYEKQFSEPIMAS